MPFMKAPYDSEIRSLTGHILVAKANEVINVPDVVVPEAQAIGWQHTEAPPKVEAPQQLSDNVTVKPSVSVDEFEVQLDQAVLRVLTRNVESDFKADGVPKLNAVLSEMDPDVKKPTAGQILKSFERLQSNINLAED